MADEMNIRHSRYSPKTVEISKKQKVDKRPNLFYNIHIDT